MKKGKGIIVSLIVVIGLFVMLHSTETLAIRTRLVTSGHPIAAFTSPLNKTGLYDQQTGRQYVILANIKDSTTGNSLTGICVKKSGLLYFAQYGEG